MPSNLDLPAAVAKARAIVRGKVTAQRLEFSAPGDEWKTRVVSTLTVTKWLKGGDSSTTVDISQPGSAELGDDLKPFLETDAADPVVHVGDDVIVFVATRNAKGYLVPLRYKILTVTGGGIEPNALDTPLAPLHGRPASTVLVSIAAAVASTAGSATVTP